MGPLQTSQRMAQEVSTEMIKMDKTNIKKKDLSQTNASL